MSIFPSSSAIQPAVDETAGVSLRLNDDDSAYLSWTPSSIGNRRTWTWSGWVKLGSNIDAVNRTFSAVSDSLNYTRFTAPTSGVVAIYQKNSNSVVMALNGTEKLRDVAGWYHFVCAVDTTQSTASDRVKIYINGTESSLSGTYPSQNLDTWISHTVEQQLGRDSATNTYMDGYMAEVNFIDGQALDATSFGETDANGQWIPKAYSGSYGTNGFYLDFDGTYYDDKSGNGNDWTANNLAATDVVLDSPTNNFATLNPLDSNSGHTLSEGNLKVIGNSTTSQRQTKATFAQNSGKWYWEIYQYSGGNRYNGIGTEDTSLAPLGTGSIVYNQAGAIYLNGSSVQTGLSGNSVGDVLGVALDLDSGTITWYVNNTVVNSGGYSFTVGTDYWHPMVGVENSLDSQFYNFGQDSSFAGNKTAQGNTDDNGIGDFYYAPPSGYLALCTDNLPDPTVVPEEHFNTVLYTGNGTSQSITGVGFQPDWVWIKPRNTALYHFLTDKVRGVSNTLSTNTTDAESFSTEDVLSSFDSDGFSVTADDGAGYYGWNRNADSMVAWNWKAGGSGVSNTDGSITSTVSANTDAGFSIVSYTGTGSAGSTFGHGLNSAPEFVIWKDRSSGTQGWIVQGNNIGDPVAGNYLYLNLTNAKATSVNVNTTFGASTITLDVSGTYNVSGDNYIAYCFHSVDGFSKFGSYTGNGAAVDDGPFVYTGFRPAFVMFKRTDSSASWLMWDAARDTYNEVRNYLRAEDSAVEGNDGGGSNSWQLDLLSNGFKIRSNGSTQQVNPSGGTLIYMAFAEKPFKYANAR